MKTHLYKPFLWMIAFITIVSLACNMGSASTSTPTPTPTPNNILQKPSTQAPATEVSARPTATQTQAASSKSGAVSTLDDVEKAVIQIEADGTFVDPQVGWQVNVGKMGTGFIIDPSGVAITNNHVVTGAALLKVWVGGETTPRHAKVLGVSECSDLAVIKVDGDGYPYLDWYSGAIKVGLKVFAAGFPLGDPNFTLTDGIVSKAKAGGKSSWASVGSVIEHSARINPGNSGGPLVDSDGKVVGINYASIAETGQNFAIGRDEALKVIDLLKSGKNIDSIGINGGAISGKVNNTDISGVWVRSVASGSPADKARIQAGDIIYQMEGQVLATDGTMADYCDILSSHNATDTMAVTVIRYSDLSLLEGQLNGRELATKGYFTGNGSAGATGTPSSDYTTITDNKNIIQLEVPAAWSDVDGSEWTSDWSGISFTAPAVEASPNLKDYNNYKAPGVFFTASDRLGEIGGFIQLLDGVTSWFETDCTRDRSNYHVDYGKGDWEDPLYEGKFDVWKKCKGTDMNVFVLAARPKATPTAYLMLVMINYEKDSDLQDLVHILSTFQVIGSF
jgi:serine protease Do